MTAQGSAGHPLKTRKSQVFFLTSERPVQLLTARLLVYALQYSLRESQ